MAWFLGSGIWTSEVQRRSRSMGFFLIPPCPREIFRAACCRPSALKTSEKLVPGVFKSYRNWPLELEVQKRLDASCRYTQCDSTGTYSPCQKWWLLCRTATSGWAASATWNATTTACFWRIAAMRALQRERMRPQRTDLYSTQGTVLQPEDSKRGPGLLERNPEKERRTS